MADGGRGGPPRRFKLFIPGPCQVSGDVLQAMAQPPVAHYGPYWIEFHQEVVDLLKQVFQTRNDLFIVPGSGSAGSDMAVGSLLSPGEAICVGANGLFGERLSAIATACGLRVVPLAAPQGHPLDPEELGRILAQEPDVQAVTVVHHETATTRPFLMELLFGVEMFLRQRGLDVPVGTGLVGLAGLEERTGETSIAGTDQRLM